jgi:hypothetical protein
LPVAEEVALEPPELRLFAAKAPPAMAKTRAMIEITPGIPKRFRNGENI